MKRKKIIKNTKKNFIITSIKENYSNYFKIILLFIIGISIGVVIANKRNDNEIKDTNDFINELILDIKEEKIIPKMELLKKSVLRNTIIISVIWILGLTFFGKYLLYLVILFFGIMLGYTWAAIFSSLSFLKGILFLIVNILPQNIIFIPSLIFVSSNGIILHNKIKESKQFFSFPIKYSGICLLGYFFWIISSFMETYACTYFFGKILKYL